MSDNKSVFLQPDDKRTENWHMAIRLCLRELKALKVESVDKVLKRWNVTEIEIGNTIKLGIEFPADLDRFQWFKKEGFELRHVSGVKKNGK